MSDYVSINRTLIAEGYSGFPVQTQPQSGERAPGSIEWLLDAVSRHASAEQTALEQYHFIGSSSGDPVIALVMRLILEDEERHHGLLKRIEASLSDALNWTHSAGALPEPTVPQAPVVQSLAVATRELVDEEHTGARYLRGLAHRERDIGGGLHSLLLDMMAMDSEKHARMLEFVQARLATRARAENGPND